MSVATETQTAARADNRPLVANRIVGLLAWLGVFIAGVLSYSHLMGKQVPCGASAGCVTVAQHESSRWFGVPVAFVGLAGYLVLAALATARPFAGPANWRLLTNISFFGTVFGFLVSVYFMYTSFVVIQAECLWCIASAVTMTFSCILTFWLWGNPDPAVVTSKADTVIPIVGFVAAVAAILGVTMKMDKDMDTVSGFHIGNLKAADIVPIPAKVRGNKDAPVTIVEFADFNCSACRAAAPTMLEVYQNAGGKIKWGFRNVPLVKLKGHETSMHVATLSQLAAEKGLFWEFFDEAFKETNTERLKSIDGVKQVATDIGLKPDDIEAALDPASTAAAGVVDDTDLSIRLGIDNTPTFLILADGAEPRAVVARRLKSVLEEQPYKKLLGGN